MSTLYALFVLASEAAGEAEKSETPFYIVGCLFAAWAVVIGALGLRSESFPPSRPAGIAISAISILLAAATMAMALYVTS